MKKASSGRCLLPLRKSIHIKAIISSCPGEEEDGMDQLNDYIIIKAKDNGVQVIGLTRGHDTRFHHTEKLDKGEIMIAQFTDHTSAMKIRGKAKIYTKHGTIDTEE